MSRLKKIGNEIAAFFTSMIIIRGVAGIIAACVAFFFLVTWGLSCYTRHGESVQVQDYTKISLPEAIKKARNKGFRVEITDSLFVVGQKPNQVIEQSPKPGAKVKKNRTIYLTVTKSTPDEVLLPSLVGNYDYNQYTRKLKLLGVEAIIKEKVMDSRENNTIKHFYYKNQLINQEKLEDGFRVPMGSTLEFVVTQMGMDEVLIPELVCLTYSAANFLVTGQKLSIGTVHAVNIVDKNNAYVYKQEPESDGFTKIQPGQTIDIYLTESKPIACDLE